MPTPPIAGLQDICADVVEVLGDQQRARAHPRRRERGLDAGVAAADDDDVVLSGCRSRHGIGGKAHTFIKRQDVPFGTMLAMDGRDNRSAPG